MLFRFFRLRYHAQRIIVSRALSRLDVTIRLLRKEYMEQLGCPSNKMDTELRDIEDRIPIEGKFEQGKMRFGIGRIRAKMAQSSETVIAIILVVMNLENLLPGPLLEHLFCCLGSSRTA